MAYQAPDTTLTPSNPYLDLNLNMNLNPKTTNHDDMYDVKHHSSDTLWKTVLFDPNRQIGISHATSKVMSLLIWAVHHIL